MRRGLGLLGLLAAAACSSAGAASAEGAIDILAGPERSVAATLSELDVAEAVALLVTNDFITGETLTIDGGMTMRIV